MSEKNTDSWTNRNQFKVVVIVILIIWLTLLAFYFMKADEITRDPCSICAEKMGSEVVCTIMQTHPVSKTYYPNGSSDDNLDEVAGKVFVERKEDVIQANLSNLQNMIPG